MNQGNTKARGDVAEYRLVHELLERGFDVLMPCGDRLPYDVGADVHGRLLRFQVRRAWFNEREGNYHVDIRRSQTNRRQLRHSKHDPGKYDFLVAWIPGTSVFYILPSAVANSYSGNICLVETDEPRQRRARSADYRNAWNLLDAGRVLAPDLGS